jgi:Zn-dependent alcohol dehydrogenase
MKGAVVPNQGAPMEIRDNLDVPKPGDNQILVKSVYAAINPVYVLRPNPTLF